MIIFLSLICLLAVGSPAALASSSALAPDETEISDRAIRQPLNRFLLIQRGDYLGAIIFGPFEQSGKGNFIRYRAFKNSPASWQADKEGEIGMRRPTFWEKAFGMIGIHTSPMALITRLELDGFALLAHTSQDGRHAIIYFGLFSPDLDPTIKMAPTPWREIKEVSAKDGCLKWFSAYGPEKRISIDELWKK